MIALGTTIALGFDLSRSSVYALCTTKEQLSHWVSVLSQNSVYALCTTKEQLSHWVSVLSQNSVYALCTTKDVESC
ncbi:hypothetical protein GJ496_005704 [Pomphorhynchus laevis]|nr:hypothetical protein GJ496_005704 [Pomphorhynchus laevis]